MRETELAWQTEEIANAAGDSTMAVSIQTDHPPDAATPPVVVSSEVIEYTPRARDVGSAADDETAITADVTAPAESDRLTNNVPDNVIERVDKVQLNVEDADMTFDVKYEAGDADATNDNCIVS